jgi:hypothetical protein
MDFNHSSRESVVQGSVAQTADGKIRVQAPSFQSGEIQHMDIKYLNYKKELLG